MLITITIDTSSDAFYEHGGMEVSRILDALSTKYVDGRLDLVAPLKRKLLDVNGNHCGTLTHKENPS